MSLRQVWEREDRAPQNWRVWGGIGGRMCVWVKGLIEEKVRAYAGEWQRSERPEG